MRFKTQNIQYNDFFNLFLTGIKVFKPLTFRIIKFDIFADIQV